MGHVESPQILHFFPSVEKVLIYIAFLETVKNEKEEIFIGAFLIT